MSIVPPSLAPPPVAAIGDNEDDTRIRGFDVTGAVADGDTYANPGEIMKDPFDTSSNNGSFGSR